MRLDEKENSKKIAIGSAKPRGEQENLNKSGGGEGGEANFVTVTLFLSSFFSSPDEESFDDSLALIFYKNKKKTNTKAV